MHCLVLLVLGRNGAQTVFDLVPGHGYVFTFDAAERLLYIFVRKCLGICIIHHLLGNMAEYVLATAAGCNEAVSLAAAEGFHNSGHHRIFQGPSRATFFFLGFCFFFLRWRVFGFLAAFNTEREKQEEAIKSMSDDGSRGNILKGVLGLSSNILQF